MQGLSQIRQRLALLADIDKKIIVKEAVRMVILTVAVIAVILAVMFTILTVDNKNNSKQISTMRGNILNEIQ